MSIIQYKYFYMFICVYIYIYIYINCRKQLVTSWQVNEQLESQIFMVPMSWHQMNQNWLIYVTIVTTKQKWSNIYFLSYHLIMLTRTLLQWITIIRTWIVYKVKCKSCGIKVQKIKALLYQILNSISNNMNKTWSDSYQ